MEERARELVKQGNYLFSKRAPILSLWQEQADHFYPERADFTVSRSLGTEFAEHLMTSYPVLARQELGNSFSAMLRNASTDWYRIRVAREEREDQPGTQWLEWASATMRRAMYDRASQFVRATKEGDHDFATFGQTVLSAELNRNADGLLYRCWHLRDVAWCENHEGQIDTVHRKWKPTARDLVAMFPKSVHPKIRELATKDPYCEVECRHVVIPADQYSDPIAKKWRTRFVSVFLDVENEHVMEEVGIRNLMYVIPRWQTVSGSQYAFSPCTIAALPDARLIQAMTRVLLEAGEKAVTPPMIAVQDAIRSDVAVYSGGITWVDEAFDQRLGEVLRPISQEKNGIPLGMELRENVREMIAQAFFLNKLNLPPAGKDMTAYEVSERIKEFIRHTLPLFEPMEMEYNGALCEITFDIMMQANAFGSPDQIPESLRGQEIQFQFESPLHEAIEKQKSQKFVEMRTMLAETVQLDPSVNPIVDMREAFRDALVGNGTPAKWLRSEDEVEKINAEAAEIAQAQQEMSQIGQGAAIAEQFGKANQALSEVQ